MRFCSQSGFIALIFYIRGIKHANKIYVQQQTQHALLQVL